MLACSTLRGVLASKLRSILSMPSNSTVFVHEQVSPPARAEVRNTTASWRCCTSRKLALGDVMFFPSIRTSIRIGDARSCTS